MSKIIEDKLIFAAKNNFNVLLIGHAGVGKTSMVKSVFESLNIKYLYYSCPTMDPWVDFVGVPHEVQDENGVKYLDLVRPKAFAYDEVEAIFMDEYNRSNQKIRNSVMELMQFKSINGKKFNNLKLVWAAINPSQDDGSGKKYDVDEIDPAQLDRFDIHIDIPYELNKKYFKEKYPEYAQATIEWWNALPTIQQQQISPRRMDKALNVYQAGGDINWALPKGINTSSLLIAISSGTFIERVEKCFNEQDEEKTKALMLEDDNVLSKYMDIIFKNNNYINYFMQYINDEKLVSLISNYNTNIINYVLKEEIAEKRLDLINTILKRKCLKKKTLDEFKAVYYKISSKLLQDQKIDVDLNTCVDPNFGVKFESITNSSLYITRVSSNDSTSNDRKNALNILQKLNGGIYQLVDENILKKIVLSIDNIVWITRTIDHDSWIFLAKMLNSCLYQSKRINVNINFKNLKCLDYFNQSVHTKDIMSNYE
jgi:hypothetical protein